MGSKLKKGRISWQKQFDTVAQYCEDQYGFDVQKEPDECSEYIPLEKKIIIQENDNPEICFYYLLHEVGHLLFIKAYGSKFDKTVGFVYDNFCINSLVYKTTEVEEEFEAWKIGLELAKSLSLRVNRKKYEKVKAAKISSYFIWAIERKIKKRIKDALLETDTKLINLRRKRKNEN